jgi:SPP1 gp7 family putative phage head morphogenesis protein
MPIPTDHPHRNLFARLEKQATDDIAQALDRLRKDVMRGVNRDNVQRVFDHLADREINERLRQGLYMAMLPTADAAFEMARAEMEAAAMGVKSIADAGFNWELVNEAVRAWLRSRTFLLTYDNEFSVTRTTAKRLRGYIDDFVRSPDMTINQLGDLIGGLFDKGRAERIAVTEVTKTFARGNQTVWRESGLVEKQRWNTAVDELVCFICAPLNGTVVGVNENWPGYLEGPPAHVLCRCWVTPVVEVHIPEPGSDEAFIQHLDDTGFENPLAYISPPPGRAPRGMGQEYADRRAIVKMIDRHSRYRSKLQDSIYNYRGTRRDASFISYARMRIQELDKAIATSIEVAHWEGGVWDFKRETIAEIFDYISWLTRSAG